MGFRDYADAKQFEEQRFTEDEGAFVTKVKSLVAQGGGDGPEDVLGGLCIAADWDDWKGRAKVI